MLMNDVLLWRVREHIALYPERFCAAQWAWAANVRAVLQAQAQPEDFRCCIGGHVLLQAGYCDEVTLLRLSVTQDDGFIGREAARLLQLPQALAQRLFYPTCWPEPQRQRYYSVRDFREEAKLALEVIDWVRKAAAGVGPGVARKRSSVLSEARV